VFSSRRRHTRFSRDWSSDVCPSDLLLGGAARMSGPPAAGLRRPRRPARSTGVAPLLDAWRARWRRFSARGLLLYALPLPLVAAEIGRASWRETEKSSADVNPTEDIR